MMTLKLGALILAAWTVVGFAVAVVFGQVCARRDLHAVPARVCNGCEGRGYVYAGDVGDLDRGPGAHEDIECLDCFGSGRAP